MTDADGLEKNRGSGSADSTSVVAGAAPEPAICIVVPGRPDVVIRLANLSALLSLAEKQEKQQSVWQILRGYLPVLTPLAALFVSVLAFYYTHQFNARTSASSASETLGKLISEAGQGSTDRANRIAEMKIAAYGEQGLVAVKMAMADDILRHEGALVAKDMYRTETVDRSDLTGKMLGFYDNPLLRLGVVQWFHETGKDLSPADRARGVAKLKASFGESAEHCAEQQEQSKGVPLEAAKFLALWRGSEDSRALIQGMIANCNKDVQAQLQQ